MNRRKVKRDVPMSKYEFNERGIEEWWEDVFKQLEEKSIKKKPERHPSIVAQVIPKNMYHDVATILGLEGDRPMFESKPKQSWLEMQLEKDGKVLQLDQDVEVEKPVVSILEEEKESIISLFTSDLIVEPPTNEKSKLEDIDYEIPTTNPYFNFFRRSEKNAACWRPVEQLGSGKAMDLSVLLNPELTLSQKAFIITETITTKFCEWMRGLGGNEKINIDEYVLTQLFENGFDLPAAHSLQVQVRELPVVSEAIAKACKCPQASEHAGLLRILRQGIRAEARTTRLVAFGSTIPVKSPVRFKAPTNHVRKNWFQCDTVPKELSTMSEVWEGITNLRSTIAFCEWLKKHPEIPPPQYLKNHGLFGEQKRSKLRTNESTEDQVSLEYVERLQFHRF